MSDEEIEIEDLKKIEKNISDDESEPVTSTSKQIIIILEDARLETVKTKKGFSLLSSDDNKGLHRKLHTDPKDYRPDITHQCLLTLLDSPLNKAGLLKIYIHTSQNILIYVNPKLRIPRTYRRFEGLMSIYFIIL